MRIDTSKIDDIISKLKRKDPILAEALRKKIRQIELMESIGVEHFKNLRGNLKEYKRAHVGSFVLMFKVKDDIIIFEDFRHHDNAY